MSKIHFINQYIYPDGSPVCLISEQVAEYLFTKKNVEVVMVGGAGEYRPSSRNQPNMPLVNLPTLSFKRETKIDILKEYWAVYGAFKKYVKENVQDGDTLVVTSSPFLNVMLRNLVDKKRVRTIFWLFDYFPASLKSMNIPFLYNIIKFWWDRELRKYDSVIKISSNLGYFESNSVVHRQWNMIDIQPDTSIIPERKALYTGNLGIAHDVDSLAKECAKLRDDGYEINIHADGPGLEKLPDWLKLKSRGIFKNAEDLKKALHEHEIHLITGTPGTDELSFPSKIWNSIAAGKEVIAAGFYGKMIDELAMTLEADYKKHLPDCAEYILAQSKIKK
jgi:glycosyltransferase involved in cell wall biosynthesis